MIKIKEIDAKFANADAETRRQLKDLAVEEAFKSAVNEDELKELKEKLDETYAKATQANRKADIANLELSKKADKSELHKHESQLEIPILKTEVLHPRVENKKEPSLLSELLKVIKNRKK